jgi:hypothetical protein
MSLSVPPLSVIVVTWNCAATIAECLFSLQASDLPPGAETILVDNASTDGTADLVARDFPWVRLIRGAENLGFARANNLAMTQARGETLLLLNPDAVLTDPGVIACLRGVLAGDPGIGLAGCRLVHRDGRHQVGDAGFRPAPFNMVIHGLGLGHALRAARPLYLVRPDRYGEKVVDVDWICGACLMLPRAVLDAVGGLDERLFLYAEDIEWGCRIRDHGFRAAYLPGVRVMHLQGGSEAQATTEAVPTRWLSSLLALSARLSGGRGQWPVRMAFALGFAARAAVYRALSLLRPRRRGHYRNKGAALLAYAQAAARFGG